jgi:hypothetical protein
VKKVLALVEGPTEEAFIKQVLLPALPQIILVPIIIKTRLTGAKPVKGGTVTYYEFKRQLQLLLDDPSAALVTTMIDFQGLGSDFPGRAMPEGSTPIAKVLFVEETMRRDLNETRYHPYLALHEFEALLFAKPESIADVLERPALTKVLQDICEKHPKTPEDINDSPATSPSARIESACEQLFGSARVFQKRTHGPMIAARIGLEKIRAECPHFNNWITQLEKL